MADTMAFALIGALLITLTLVPVLASYWFKKGVKEKDNRIFNWIRDQYSGRLEWWPRSSENYHSCLLVEFSPQRCCSSLLLARIPSPPR